MQDSWLSARADEIQGYADMNDMKIFYSTLLMSADRTRFISDKNKILERWAEYFDGVLNRSSSLNDKAINNCCKSQWMSHSMSFQPWRKFR